jgi:hypothetical protein
MGATGGRFRNQPSHSHRRQPDAHATWWSRTFSLVAAAAIPLLTVAASPSPTPSPTLDRVLAAPVSSGYSEVAKGQGLLEGPFTAQDFAGSGPDAAQATLVKDGFVAGFGRTWFDQSRQHELAELVIAFSGAAGAKKWLGSSEKVDKADQFYAHAIPVAGIEKYYGVHLANPTQPSFIDIVAFIKGNDFFAVGFASQMDDLGTSVAKQAKGQFDFAPSHTIAPSQWPENRSTATDLIIRAVGGLVFTMAIVAFLAGAVFLVVGVNRRRRGGIATPAFAGGGHLHMSPDGSYWWDGQAWRDASRDVPPGALRSADGYYWWDGRVWRPVPEPPPS